MNACRTERGSFALRAIACTALGLGIEPVLADDDDGDDDVLELIGIVRDFLPSHPDFDVVPPQGYGQYMWNVATTLGEHGRPVYVGGGFKVQQHARDDSGRDICWTLYDQARGDSPAVAGNPDDGSVESAESFDEWFRDIPGVNMSMLHTVAGSRRDDDEYEGMYEINIPQFYPIDGMLLGNDSNHNRFFTYVIVAEFEYDADADYQMYFKSDDDAWLFIDGLMVADLGGINGSSEQWIELDRLDLVDGQTYRMRLLKTDRSDASCRFHLVTDVPLRGVLPPTILAMFD